jgi:hypothetical protein
VSEILASTLEERNYASKKEIEGLFKLEQVVEQSVANMLVIRFKMEV